MQLRGVCILSKQAALTAVNIRACSKRRPVWLQMVILFIPVLTYLEYAPLRYSKITIFAHTCRFLIQALSASGCLQGGFREFVVGQLVEEVRYIVRPTITEIEIIAMLPDIKP